MRPTSLKGLCHLASSWREKRNLTLTGTTYGTQTDMDNLAVETKETVVKEVGNAADEDVEGEPYYCFSVWAACLINSTVARAVQNIEYL